MQKNTFLLKSWLLVVCILISTSIYSQTADFKVQHLQDDVPKAGSTITSFSAVASLNNAIAIANNNRKSHAGSSSSGGNTEGDDMAGARQLTGTGTLTYYRESGSSNSNMRFNTSIWEYIGPATGNNEMIIRGRYAVTLNGTTNSVTQALSGIINVNKCIPFITGIMNNATSDDADSGTAIAYLENSTTLRIQKGSNGNNVTVYITVVEFIGNNWTVLHGDSGDVSADTGSITLRDGSDGTGTTTNVSDWSDAIIFSHHRADTGASGTNDAIADQWPLMDPGNNNQTVDWTFSGNHDSAGTNRQFVHVLINSGLNVTRYQNTSNGSGATNIDISSASLSSINEALIIGSSISSGGGSAYARGWKNYYFNSSTQATHWAHRSGNSMSHEIQIIDLSGLTTSVSGNEINIQGNAISITDGDTTPSAVDDTDFGNVNEASGTNANTFIIQNTGNTLLNLTGSSPYVVISGTNAADFTLTVNPTTPIVNSGTTSFDITFDPSALGLRTANLTIANDDSDENPYNFSIQGTGTNLCGGYVNSFPNTEDFESGIGQWIQDTGDNFNWTRQSGGTPSSSTGPAAADSGSYYMFTEASSNNNNTGNFVSPCFDLTSTSNPRFTFFYHMYGSNMGTLNVDISTDSGISYPTSLWTNSSVVQSSNSSSWIPISIDLSTFIGQTIKIRIQGITGNGYGSDIAIDNISVIDKLDPTVGPGGITTDLALWLKANEGLSYTSGQSVSLWQDQGRGSDVRPHTTGQEPTFRDNANKNVNFNPVVEFDNTFSSFSLDGNFTHNDITTEFLIGDFGYFTQEVFIVLIPDDTTITNSFGFMDIICGDSTLNTNSTDTTGLGFGDFTGRVSNEVICYAYDTYTSSESGDGYAVAEIGTGSTYDNVGIINTRNNTANTQQELYYNANDIETTQNDIAEYNNSSDTRFWIARSEGWEATTNARIAEVISYSVRKTDTDLTVERNRIQSYLAIKYGITLGVNGTSQDYVNSDGTVIWDVNTGTPTVDVFNYDITGFGRDDASDLYQKQSRSVNNALDGSTRGQGVLTMGISSIYDTNNLNPNTLNDKEFLIWGNDGVDLDDPALIVDVDLSSSITPTISGGTWVQFNGIARTWKVTENGGDIPSVEVAILKNAIRTAAPPNGIYLMFISDTPNFDPTADYRVMSESTNELGEAIFKTNYDFDNIKYITFGWAPERVFERSIFFNGTSDYVEMEDTLDLNPFEFTISSWIKRESGSKNKSILSKRDLAYTEGYDFKINNTGRLQVSWINGSTQTITSNTIIPIDEWHQVAIIYSGGVAYIYIDGVLDETASLSAPVATSQSFNIAAAGKGTLGAYFKGNIDEVRVWNSALSLDELHYIMNQEIEDNSNFVGPSYFISRGITPTKNEVNTLPWGDLAGYYPMSTYTYTNTKDESGNGNQGALRNLRTVDRQTAPLPYESTQDGDWDDYDTWLNGDVQNMPGTKSIVNNQITVDWNIVKTNHNVTLDNLVLPTASDDNRAVLGLFVDSNKLTVTGDHATNKGFGLTVTHYLNLDGKIDLEGESQLIQTLDSDLEVASYGTLEKDQQGTKDLFTYNYWSSPVGISNITTNNNNYTLPDILNDGTNSASPLTINFLTSGYDGTSGVPIGIADYWIWKYSNNLSDDYSQWQHIRSTGIINAGEGYTMKGVEDTASAIQQEQNYVFEGKPNNGNITHTITLGNDYLVGNPYPSALDADEFIYDNIGITDGGRNTNGNVINGALYFWDHFASSTHVLAEYEGGYATYTLMGGAAAISNDARINANGGVGTKYPKRYIPVSQGFFVSSILDAGLVGLTQPIVGGNIVFKNNQRIYKKETTTGSIFLRSSSETNLDTYEEEIDSRPKIRLMFDSPNGYHRQLLVGVDEKTTNDFDLGYEAILIESNNEDMFWLFNNTKFIIQAVNNFNNDQVLPFGVKTNEEGLSTIKIEELENIEISTNIFVHDKELNIYHDLKQSNYEVNLSAGEHLDRFEITFSKSSLNINDFENENLKLLTYYSNYINGVVLLNPYLIEVKSLEIFNVLGQSINLFDNIEAKDYTTFKTNISSSGTYIIKINTENVTISKKVLVE